MDSAGRFNRSRTQLEAPEAKLDVDWGSVLRSTKRFLKPEQVPIKADGRLNVLDVKVDLWIPELRASGVRAARTGLMSICASFAAPSNLGVRREDLEPPHSITVGVGKIEPTDYLRIRLDFGRRDVAFS